MHFKFRHLEKIVGAFFILTCVIIIFLLVIVARGQRWFAHYVPYSCYFENGGGLHVGSIVMIQGLEAGKVKRVTLDQENKVKVDVEILKQFSDRVREESLVKLSTPMIGSSTIEIVLGPQDRPAIPPRGIIPSKAVSGGSLDVLIESATALVKKLGDANGDLMLALGNINRGTKDLSDSLAKKDGSLRMFIERRELYDDLKKSAGHLEDILAAVDEKAPDLSDAVTEARRGLEEANKVILALQKSFLVRGNIERYLKEDSTLRVEGRAR